MSHNSDRFTHSVVFEPCPSRPPALASIYGTTALQREVSPDSKPSEKSASPPRIVKGCGVIAVTVSEPTVNEQRRTAPIVDLVSGGMRH